MTDPSAAIEDLFRREWASLIAMLARRFGPSHLDLAEDVVQEALERAMSAWRLGLPTHPKAWIVQTAKRCAIDRLRHLQRADRLTEAALDVALANLSPEEDASNQLAMMFSLCDEDLGSETHVTLILRFLCGFGPREIAHAFIVDTATIDRRLHRGKERLRALGTLADVSDAAVIARRLPSVLCALYLMFNEGYQGSDQEQPIHPALCRYALQLAELLLDDAAISRPEIHALAALFCLHAARLSTRLDDHGVFLRLAEQDRTRWDQQLISRGVLHLSQSAAGDQMTRWHLEAAIAAEHALAPSLAETNWSRIVALYEELRRESPSPVVEIGYAMAVAELRGVAAGRAALDQLDPSRQLARYPFFWAARAELEVRAGNPAAARELYAQARALARNSAERDAYDRQLEMLAAQR